HRPSNPGFLRESVAEAGLAFAAVSGALFFGAVEPWAFMALCALIFLLLVVLPEAAGELAAFPAFFRCAALLLLGLLTVQGLLTSLNRFATLEELLKWLAMAGVLALTQKLRPAAAVRLLAVLAVLGFLESLYGWCQIRTGLEKVLWRSKTEYVGCLTGTLINRNHAACLLAMCLGVQSGLFMRCLGNRSLRGAAVFGAIFLVTLSGLLRTGSRMGCASFLAAVLIFLPALMRKVSARFAAVTAFLLAAGFAAAFLVSGELLGVRLGHAGDALILGEGRWVVWRDTLAMIRDHWPWGIGLGAFPWVYPAYQSPELAFGWSHAHNDYLEVCAELGIPGFLVLISGFAALGWRTIREWLVLKAEAFFVAWGMMVSVTAFLIHGLGDFNGAIFANRFLMVLLLGLAVRWCRLARAGSEGA
ncbi:MAG: O-antigen ligase family protein, partial [Candidatus Omnitrophota bacterium]